MKKSKSKLLVSAYLLLASTLLIAAVPTEAEAKIYEDTVRLHILANSDSEEDQCLKLKIRDRLLENYGNLLNHQNSAEAAASEIKTKLADIEKDVNRWIKDCGYSYSAKATLCEEWYETREYESFTLPKGIYKSLKIIIGDGGGKNWWCVMYPPLCTSIASEKAPKDDGIDYSSEEILLISNRKYAVKFKILEILSEAFTKNG